MSSNWFGKLVSVITKGSPLRWFELILLLPMLVMLPFAALFAGAGLLEGNLRAIAFSGGGVLGGLALAVVVMLSTATLQRRRWLSRGLVVCLLSGSAVALQLFWLFWTETDMRQRSVDLTSMLPYLNITLIPLLLTVRHLPRLLRAACFAPVTPPSPPVPHVQ